ncbi:MAG TPA: hypothetical protein VFS21_29800 [Roseiflexaceae bacterium]|nr:hypothetical protein [Roseiflexaceae bacterium]
MTRPTPAFRRPRRRHLAERLDAQRSRLDTQSGMIRRLADENTRQDDALTELESRVADLEVQNQALRQLVRDIQDALQLSDLRTRLQLWSERVGL